MYIFLQYFIFISIISFFKVSKTQKKINWALQNDIFFINVQYGQQNENKQLLSRVKCNWVKAEKNLFNSSQYMYTKKNEIVIKKTDVDRAERVKFIFKEFSF